MTVATLKNAVQLRTFRLLAAGSTAVRPKPRALRPRNRNDEARLNDTWNSRLEAAKGGDR
jgi:hypothetical protein